MRVLSTAKQRTELLQKLYGAPSTEEVKSAIRIVEEAVEYAELRDLVLKMFEVQGVPDSFEKVVEQGWVHNEMRPFVKFIDELRENTRLQKFKAFYSNDTDWDWDDDDSYESGWKEL